MTPDLFFKNRLSKKGPRRSGVKCGRGYIKRSKHIRTIGIATSSLLVLLTALAIFPIVSHDNSAEAIFVPATTTLSIISSKNTASVDATPISSTGTFVTSSADNMAEFTVTTDNLTGYSVTLLGSDASGQLVNDTTGDTLDSITADTTENDFRTGSASTYNNKWGYRLNINNTTTTNFLSAPTSTTVAKTIYSTTRPNTTGTSDSFTLGLGARIDYTKPTGTYTNTFIIAAIANNISYRINYLDSDTTTTLLPSDAESNISASSIDLNSTTPTKSGYEFKGWCDGTLSSDGESCTGTPGTTYQPGDTYTFTTLSSTTSNIANLYAVWEESAPIMQDLNPTLCTTSPTTVVDKRDNNEYTIRRLPDGNCWMTQNLRFTGTSLSSTTSNVASTYTDANPLSITWGDLTSGDSFTAARLKVGTDANGDHTVWYNYAGASAMTITGTSNNTNAMYDICPAGWRLPTRIDFNGILNYRTEFNPVHSGYWISGSLSNKTVTGNWFSSTHYDSSHVYFLADNNNGFYITSGDATAGTRQVGRSVRCIMNDTRTISDITNMQDVNSQVVANTADGATKTLKDTRDNQQYSVVKYNDKLWMTRNLAIGCDGTGSTYGSNILTNGKALTPANSNISSNWTTPTGSLKSLGNDITNPLMECSDTYGAWYNYPAATAGTITGSSNSTEATSDICPTGWKLPAYSELQTAAAFRNVFSPVAGGYYATKTIYQPTRGYWWASTAYNATYRRNLRYTGSSLDITTDSRRDYASYIRCISK